MMPFLAYFVFNKSGEQLKLLCRMSYVRPLYIGVKTEEKFLSTQLYLVVLERFLGFR